MALEIRILQSTDAKHAGTLTVKLIGSLDGTTAPELERQLTPVVPASLKDLVFDVAELKFISSAGLRMFAIARRNLKEEGGQVSFINAQPQVQEALEIMLSIPGVAIFKDEEELDRYLAERYQKHKGNN